MKAIILAGGSGTRLWPLSRQTYPKQFLNLSDNGSLIQLTALRLSKLVKPDDIYVISPSIYFEIISSHLSEIFHKPFKNIITEPVPKNTAPAIALGIKYLLDNGIIKKDEYLLFCPADHIIKGDESFINAVKQAEKNPDDKIILFGIKPDRAETGYGYIQTRKSSNPVFSEVVCFLEKPDLDTAKKLLEKDDFVWNSGMFLFTADSIMSEFKKNLAEVHRHLEEDPYDVFLNNFVDFNAVSFDKGILEKSSNIKCVNLQITWNDVGSLDSLHAVLEKDASGNVIEGDVVIQDVSNSIIISKSMLLAALGIKNMVIIEAEDAILVANMDQSQKVRDIVMKLQKDRRKEVIENKTTYRPWGKYTVLEESENYKIKKIVVNPKSTLSLQRHKQRSEHWIVVTGTACIRINDNELEIHKNESAYVPKNIIHRLANPFTEPLEIIEVQNGDYLGEDDIERIDDVYGRI